MISCPSCGEENPDKFRLCGYCGAPLRGAATLREARKTVTVLFADVSGSTALGERLDPESLRLLMSRYFAAIKAVIHAHGGTVEKFIGDAVMAVFGIPTVHEDDALRAVRAAAEIRDVLGTLNGELKRERGLEVVFRTGITTGEVVVGDPGTAETLATGDTINTAARLEQAARPGEILLGAPTLELVRDAATVEKVEPIVAKGKLKPVQAFRLISVDAGAAGRTRRLDAPMVGRDGELTRLRQAFDQAVKDRSAQLFTLLGSAGVGKSRLVAEFLESVASDALVLKGRCLPYGEGITYWPLREVLHMAAGISEEDSRDDAHEKLRRFFVGERDADLVSLALASAIGLSDEDAVQREIFSAALRLIEHASRHRPLVLVWEDIHWAEGTLLDLVEHIADLSRDVPVLFLCPARPELLDKRPAWGGGKMNSTTVLLEPLAGDVIARLLATLPGGTAVPAGLGQRILAAAEGNPLYLEEMLGMLVDDGTLVMKEGQWIATADVDRVRVPPTVRALLAARLDQLEPAERATAERASVAGRVFEEAAVAEMTPPGTRRDVPGALVALVRKELVRHDRSELTFGDAFRFRHILIRDAAYDGLSKRERAELHEAFANWVEHVSGDRTAEYEEIVGYHLEQGHRYRVELGQAGDELDRLADRARERFRAAGKRAVDRGDLRTAEGLFARALALRGSNAAGATLLLTDQADLLERLGRYREAEAVAERARVSADEIGDERLSARARLVMAQVRADLDPVAGLQQFLFEAEAVLPMLEEAGDHEGVARALGAIGMTNWVRGRLDPADMMYERVIEELKRGGRAGRIPRIKAIMAIVTAQGRTDVKTAGARIDEIAHEVESDPQGTTLVLSAVASIHSMAGRHAEAVASLDRAVDLARSLGLDAEVLSLAADRGMVELLGGDPSTAEAVMRPAFEHLRNVEETSVAGSLAALLAEAIARQARHAEAIEFSEEAERLLPRDDVWGQAVWRGARARALAASGRAGEAVTVAMEAVDLLEPTDFLNQWADATVALAEALAASGDESGARRALARANEAYARKGNVVMTEATRLLLARDVRPV